MEVTSEWFVNDLEEDSLIDRAVGLLQKPNPQQVERLLDMAKRYDSRLGDELKRVNRPECRNFWRKWSTKPSREEGGWDFVMDSWRRLDQLTRWILLYAALEDGKAEVALDMVKRGAPFNSRCPTGLMIQGPIANLFSGEYSKIGQDDAFEIGQAMLERGGVNMFAPANISTTRMVRLFLKYAPPPHDHDEWKHKMVFRASDVAGKEAAILIFKGEPDRIIPFLEAGYPGDHVNLLAMACARGQDDMAAALLDWPGFDPGNPQRDPEDWESDAWEVVPKSFWHFLVENWNKNIPHVRGYGWEEEGYWPGEEICRKLMSCPWLDINQADPNGNTPMDKALGADLGVHPFEIAVAAHRRRELAKIAKVNLDEPYTRNSNPKI